MVTEPTAVRSTLSGVFWDGGVRTAPQVFEPDEKPPREQPLPDLLPHLRRELVAARGQAARWIDRADALRVLVEHVTDEEAVRGRPLLIEDLLEVEDEDARAHLRALVERALKPQEERWNDPQQPD